MAIVVFTLQHLLPKIFSGGGWYYGTDSAVQSVHNTVFAWLHAEKSDFRV